MTETEKKERQYLAEMLKKADLKIAEINEAIQLKSDEIAYMNRHMEEHKRDMDHLEKNALRETIYNYTLQGIQPYSKVKHLVIDEMQDYSAVQYQVLKMLYPCKKTILGDINQSVNPFSSSNLKMIERIFSGATSMTMLKSYRSTYEITQFTKRISQNIEVEAIERHGQAPQTIRCQDAQQELSEIKKLVTQFEGEHFNSLGIICKTQKQADALHQALKPDFKANLLNATSVAFGNGIVITTAHLAKGLEFDQVIVPQCTSKNYQTQADKQMLYVACTRAMHKLYLTHIGNASQFILKS